MGTEVELNRKYLTEEEEKLYYGRTIRRGYMKQTAYILLICCFCLFIEDARAQLLDSMQIKVGTVTTVASQNYQPLWLVSNRWNTVTDQKGDLSSYLVFRNKHVFGKRNPVYSYLRSKKSHPKLSLSYGLSIFNNQHFQETFIQEGYVKVNFSHWQLAAGRYKEIIGEVGPAKTYDIYGLELHYKQFTSEIDPHLSSGSMGISGNALPIPKVSIGLIKYTDVPFFSPGWIQFKGHLSHGWMEKDAFVKDALFHERSFYLRFGKRSFNTFHIYGGLNHFIIWGGTHPERGQLWNDWKDLTKIVTPGNNLGFFDYGFNFLSKHYKFKLKAYTQVPFEGKSSMSVFRIKDRLVGFVLSDRTPYTLFSSVTIELIHSTWQDTNPENLNRENDYNFYNNERYQTGWSYAGKIIGTPLFFDRQRATHYFGENFNSTSSYDWNIVNNRIKGIHLGWKGNLFSNLYYRTLLTRTKNYGNYYNGALFVNGRNQWYFMQELIYQHKALKLNATVGWDVGELTNNIGALVGIEYDLTYKGGY